jgi:hypothetical protein
VKPLLGILAASPDLMEEACAAAGGLFGPIDERSQSVPWRGSDYYRDEMGDEIWRRFVSFAALGPADDLAGRKLRTNALEERWSDGRGRRVNLDPGHLDLQRLVLASTKDAAHRIYLRDGIYAEVTLVFERGGFRPRPHTYPDYADPGALDFFNRVRELFRRQRPPAAPR